MKYEVTGPDGQQYEVEGPPGASDQQVLAVLQQHLAANPPPPPDSGFFPALKAGAADTQAGLAALGSRLGLRDEEGAQQDIDALHKYAQRTFAPSKWSESPFTKFKEVVGGSLPNMAGLAGAGTVGTLVGGPAGGFAATAGLDALLRTGSNLQAQTEHGTPLGQTDLGAAALTALPQSLIETGAMRLIPGIGQIFGAAGLKLTEAEAMKIAQQSVSQAAADLAGKGALVAGEQGLMQVTNTALERLQAGASMTDPEARDAYLESLLGGASFGAVAGAAGRAFERHGANTVAAQAKAREKADSLSQQMQQNTEQAAAREEMLRSPEYLQQVQDNWDAAKKQLEELGKGIGALDKSDDFYKEDLAAAVKAKAEYQQGDYKKAHDAFLQARPLIEKGKRSQATMLDVAPIQGEGMQPQGRGNWRTEAPEENAPTALAQYVTDQMEAARGPTGIEPGMTRIISHLEQNPAMARQMVEQGFRIPDMKPGQQQAILSALKMRLKAQDKADAARVPGELAQRTQDLTDQTQPAVEQNPLADYEAGRQQLEDSTTNNPRAQVGQYLFADTPAGNEMWEKALAGKDSSQPIPPQANAAMVRSRITDLYNQHAQAEKAYELAMRSSDKEGADTAFEQREQARQQLDQFRNPQPAGELTKDLKRPREPVQDKPNYGSEVVKARDEQQQALTDFRSAVDGIANGEDPNTITLGATKKAIPPLVTRADQAKERYLDAAVREAQLHYAAEGQALDVARAQQYKHMISQRLDQWREAKTRHLDEMEDYTSGMEQDHAPAPNPLDTENKRSGLIPEEAANLQNRMAMLREQAMTSQSPAEREMLQTRIDQMAQQLQRHIEGNAESRAPTSAPPPRGPRANVFDNLAAMHNAFIQPPKRAQRVDTGPLKPQFPKAEEAKRQAESGVGDQSLRRRVEYVANEVDHALARKDLPQPVRATLEKVKEAIEAGHVTRDLLDEIDHLAERAIHGQGIHARDLHNIVALQKLAHDVHGLDFRENTRELPGMEPTATARGTPEEFASHPQLKAARKAIDDAKAAHDVAKKTLGEMHEWLADKVAKHEEKASSARQQFLNLRQETANAWRQAMKDWHFGDQIAEASKRVREAKEYVDRLEKYGLKNLVPAARKDVDAAIGQMEQLHKQASDMLAQHDAQAKARADESVTKAKARLDKIEQELAATRQHHEATRPPHSSVETIKARLAYDEARRQSDMLGREAKARKDAWEAKLQRGLELSGRRMENGKVEPILSGERQRAADERRASEEQRRADQELSDRVLAGATTERVRRAVGPVSRDKKGGAKNLTEARAWDHPFTKRETPNETAERLKGQPGTQLRSDEHQAKIAERETLMAQFRKARTPDEKRQIAEKVRALDKEVSGLEKAAEQQRLATDKDARKQRREMNKQRKQTKAMVRTGERHAEETRAMRAVEDADFTESLEEAGGSPFDFSHEPGATPVTPEMVKAMDSGKLAPVLQEMARASDSPLIKRMAERLAPLVGDVTLRQAESLRGPLGAYGKKTVFLQHSEMHPASQETVIHEAVHAVTQDALSKPESQLTPAQREAKQALRRLYMEVRNDPNVAGQYGMKSLKEFVAEIQANQEFRDAINHAKEGGLLKRIFTRLMELIGFKSDAASMADSYIDLLTQKPENGNGEVNYRFGSSKPESAIVGYDRSLKDKMMDHLGLRFAQQTVDKHRPLENASTEAMNEGKITPDQWLKGNYFLRHGDNASNFMAQAITHGPLKIVTDKLEGGRTQERYESQEGATPQQAAQHVREGSEALGWTPDEGEHALTVLMAGERAAAKEDGWSRLNADHPDEARAEYERYKQEVDANPQAREAFAQAKRQMKGFFDGLMDFAVQAGSISREEGQRLKSVPYVPFFREKNGVISLMDENEKPIRIGNIKDQPELQQMLGSDRKIQPIFTSAIQNAYMLMSMGLHNKATREVGNMLHEMGIASKIGKGRGSDDPESTLHWKVNGEDHFAEVDTDMFGVPAPLIVKGMAGIKTSFPVLMKLMGVPSDWLRRFVTRNPAYALRQLLRDPANAFILGAVDGMPFLNAAKHLKDMQYGHSQAEQDLMHGGAISSNVMTHNARDIDGYLRSIAKGHQEGWRGLLQRADRLAIEADAATRSAIYEDSLKKGFSRAEAEFRAMESMNFNRRGLSPSMQMLSTLVPFFNAQIQGIDVLWRSMKGSMPFAQRLDLQRKLITRGAMLAGVATTYALAMQDDEDYRKMKPAERYQNFVVRIPGMKDLVKIPIPYEVGVIFKSIPEAIIDAAGKDTNVGEAVRGLGTVALTSAPNMAPAAVWPLIEAAFGKTLYGDIETQREKQFAPRERWRENTSELAKAAGKYTGDIHLGDSQMGISPIMLEHFVRGYTGSLGVGLLHVLDPVMMDASQGQRPSKSAADTPGVGSLFQRADGNFIVNRAYDRMTHIMEVKATYDQLMKEGRKAEATRYAQDNANLIAAVPLAQAFKSQMGNAIHQERATRVSPELSTTAKDERIKTIREFQNQQSRRFYEQADKTKAPTLRQ